MARGILISSNIQGISRSEDCKQCIGVCIVQMPQCALECPSGLSGLVNCCRRATSKSCDWLTGPTVTPLSLFTNSNERKMFMSTLMTLREGGKKK